VGCLQGEIDEVSAQFTRFNFRHLLGAFHLVLLGWFKKKRKEFITTKPLSSQRRQETKKKDSFIIAGLSYYDFGLS
jgi:hypothetical protein